MSINYKHGKNQISKVEILTHKFSIGAKSWVTLLYYKLHISRDFALLIPRAEEVLFLEGGEYIKSKQITEK